MWDDFSDGRISDPGEGSYKIYAESTKVHNSAVAWSQADQPAYFVLENIRQVFRDDQDKMRGLFDDGNGVLIWKDGSIVKLYHTGAPQNWYIRKIWDKFGCDEKKSLIKVGNTYYFRYRKRPYSYVSGGVPEYIGYGKQSTLDNVTIIDVASNDEWLFYSVVDGSNYYILVYDKKIKTWYQFNCGAYQPTAIFVKEFDDFWTPGNLYIAIEKRTFEYTKDTHVDYFSGAAVYVTLTAKLPRIKLQGINPFKLRDVVMTFDRNLTEIAKLQIVSDASTFTAINIPSGDGALKLTGHGSNPSTAWMDAILTGGIKELNNIRFDLRPTRRKLGL